MLPTVWTAQRKWMGNLIPTLVWIPPTVLGLREILLTHRLIGSGLGLLVLADVLAWLALNQFGLYQNARMKKRLWAILSKKAPISGSCVFVGFSSPRYTGVLDAHEDVGFLCFRDDELAFVSETRNIDIKRAEVSAIKFRPNVHTLVGLGRWISIEGARNQTPIRMLIEPRERSTMAGNLLLGAPMRRRILKWLSEPSSPS